MNIKNSASDLLSLDGKVAVISGGASGIGLGVARKFSVFGAKVIILDIDTVKGIAAERDLKENDLDIQKQTYLWDTWHNRNNYTSAVKSTGAPMDFVSETDDFSKYPFLLAPSYQLIDSTLVMKWLRYAEDGGNLILTSRTGQKNKYGHFPEARLAAQIYSLIGAEIDFFDMLPAESKGVIKAGNDNFSWNIWADILSPSSGTEVLAEYADQFYSGKAAAVTHRIGKGTVTYIGASTSDGSFEREIVREDYEKAGAKIEDLPKGVFIEWRDGFYVSVNYTDDEYFLPLNEKCRIIIGSNPVKSACAVVWQTE
jgi:beta-galactosidase